MAEDGSESGILTATPTPRNTPTIKVKKHLPLRAFHLAVICMNLYSR